MRNIAILIVVGCFLCLNGKNCVPCALTLLQHQFLHEHHAHGDHAPGHHDDGCHGPHQAPVQDCGGGHHHEHECPDPQNHIRLVPVSLDALTVENRAGDIVEAFVSAGEDAAQSQVLCASMKLRRWRNLCEAFIDPPLFLINCQFLN